MPQDLMIFIIIDVFVYKCVRASVCLSVYMYISHFHTHTHTHTISIHIANR